MADAHTEVVQQKGPPPQRPEKPSLRKKWTEQQLRSTDGIVPIQMGSNRFASQSGMTGFGTPRNTETRVVGGIPTLRDESAANRPVLSRWTFAQLKQTDAVIPLQYGTNRHASQKGMTGFGAPRDVRGKHLHSLWEEYAMAEAEAKAEAEEAAAAASQQQDERQ